MEWNSFAWSLLIAVIPIIISVIVKLVMETVMNLSQENRNVLEYWVNVFVKTVQMIEPDKTKRKEWVIDKLTKMFPRVPGEQLSSLVEAVLASIKLEEETWDSLPPDETPVA